MIKNSFILISMRQDYLSNIKEKRDSIDPRLLKWVIKLGFTPLLVPNLEQNNFFKKSNLNFVGIIISGGNDIDKSSIRYFIEKELLRFSIKKKLPVLGICHGMQMMSHLEGGSLMKIKNHVKKNHNIINKSKSYNFPKKVNSYHNNTIKNLSNQFEIICTCHKGSIEAIIHKKYKWMGWMWHPERDRVFNKKLISLAKQFFNQL